jgi:uncharacterized protein DUF1573
MLLWALMAATAMLSACDRSVPSSVPTRAPKIAFGETTYDFGRVDRGAQVTHAFAFRNTGGLDLTIDNVRTSCECTAAAAPARVIAAGEDGTIEVIFDTTHDGGHKARTVTVYSNDPAQPVTILTLQGSIAADVTAEPRQLYLGHVARGQTVANEVRLVPDEHAVVTLAGVDAGGRVIEATLDDAAPGASGRRLRVAVKSDAPLGRFQESVIVRSTSRLHPTLSIPIAGVVDGDVVISPRTLSFGPIMPGRAASLTLAVRNQGKTPVHVTVADLVPPLGRVQISAVRDGQEYRLSVALNDPLPTGRLQGTLQIHTDHPDQSLITVPFSGRVVEKK